MLVSHHSEYDTHAVLGGGEARSFEIAQTPEFFAVLSDTLYSNKKLAVVREVLCNAYDAHIAMNRPDLPVTVTLDDSSLVITDYGPGIPHDKMHQVYCVYGASTKVHDKNQTGGFGLGCKAPFAYSHHFTVTNRNGGQSIVYAISRGSSETQAKPDCRPMVTTLKEATGVTVSIPLQSTHDFLTFDKLVSNFAYTSGIPIEFNGKINEPFDYSEARRQGFLIVTSGITTYASDAQVQLLYGNVVYPVQPDDTTLKDKIQKLSQFRALGYNFMLVALPGTIGVAPSRENLSYTDVTNQTLHALADRALRQIHAKMPQARKQLISDLVLQTYTPDLLLRLTPKDQDLVHAKDGSISDPYEIAYAFQARTIGKYSKDVRLSVIRELKRREPHLSRTLKATEKKIRKTRGNPTLRSGRILERSSINAVRIAQHAGLLGRLYAMTNPVTPISEFAYDVRTDVLLVSRTKRDAYAWMEKNGLSMSKMEVMPPAIISQKLSDEKIDQIRKRAKTLGYKVAMADGVSSPKPAKSKKSHTFFRIGHSESVYGRAPLDGTEDCFLFLSKNPHSRSNFSPDERKLIEKVFSNVIIADGELDRKHLIKMGVVSIEEKLVEMVASLAKNKTFRYAYVIQSRDFDSDLRSSLSPQVRNSSIMSFAKRHLDLAKTLFPEPLKSSPNDKDIWEKARLFSMFEDEVPRNVRDDLRNKCHTTLKILGKGYKAPPISYMIHMISPVKIYYTNDIPQLVWFVKTLQKAAKKETFQ